MAWNILIVDDSSLTRKKMKRIIEMVGLDVCQFLDAENGAEALKILDQADVDLVLSDLNMPEMSGAEMVRRMKSNPEVKSVPVVVVSAESTTTRAKELLAVGVKDYLHKPFTPEEFKEVMENLWSKTENETTQLLKEALTKALETMAFATVIPVDEDMRIPKETVSAEIEFNGARRGRIQIIAGLEFCNLLAENIAGIDEVNDQNAVDALQELANVTCGLFLPTAVSSKTEIFDVTVPHAKKCDNPSQWDEFTAGQGSSILNVEGNAIAAKITVVNEALAAKND